METKNLEIKKHPEDCTFEINGQEYMVAEIIVPATCNNRQYKYDICQIYKLVEVQDDFLEDETTTEYQPLNWFYGASNSPEEILDIAIDYILNN